MNNLGIVALENICNNLLPSDDAEDEQGSDIMDTVETLVTEVTVSCPVEHTVPEGAGEKPKRSWK